MNPRFSKALKVEQPVDAKTRKQSDRPTVTALARLRLPTFRMRFLLLGLLMILRR